jgi:hypothetical protein
VSTTLRKHKYLFSTHLQVSAMFIDTASCACRFPVVITNSLLNGLVADCGNLPFEYAA